MLLNKGFISFVLNKESISKIDAIVSNINNSYFGNEIYKTVEEKAVAYLYFLIKDHPFTDGNKRIGTIVFEIVCYINNIKPDFGDFGLDSLAVYIEKVKEEDHQKIIKLIANLLFYLK